MGKMTLPWRNAVNINFQTKRSVAFSSSEATNFKRKATLLKNGKTD
jgi:hypothetical protein